MGRATGTQRTKPITLSNIGLGKLGACYAAFAAHRGFNVIGMDADIKKVDAICMGKAPVEEPDLQKLITAHTKRLTAVHDIQQAVRESSATFIIVPTPSKKDGSFSLQPTIAVCAEIGKALKTKKDYHLITLISTVLPGNCREEIIPAVERTSGKKCGPDFGFCYSPSLIAIGEVLRNLFNPDFLFLGAFDKRSEDALAALYKKLYPHIEPERMSIESAELAKIALNSFVTMKITFANTLGEICEKLPFANVDHVTTALGKDKRIGSRYLRSGLGFGGPCFPRDNRAFANMAQKRGVDTPLARATDQINERMATRIARTLDSIARMHRAKRIGFLGISYKPRTTMIEDSHARMIADAVSSRYKYHLGIFEPIHLIEARGHFGKKATYHETLKGIAEWSDIIFISNKDDVFSVLPSLIRSGKKKIVVDPWGMFTQNDFGTHATYHALGHSCNPTIPQET